MTTRETANTPTDYTDPTTIDVDTVKGTITANFEAHGHLWTDVATWPDVTVMALTLRITELQAKVAGLVARLTADLERSSPRHDYTRDELVAICEQAVVPQEKWRNRDSASAQIGVGRCWALLAAGVDFDIEVDGDLATNHKTIWVRLYPRGFQSFEVGEDDGRQHDTETEYLPTPARLLVADGGDWY